MIAYLASDLLWASKIKGTADALGVPARPVRSLEMLEARLADSDVRGLVIDLESPPEIALALIARAAQPAGPDRAPIRILAFGPHVAVESLQAARDAGAHTVLPRGAFSANLPNLLTQLNA